MNPGDKGTEAGDAGGLTAAQKQAIRDAYGALMDARELRPRWGQRQMIAEVANTLAQVAGDSSGADAPAIAVIEAGTGTGKTIAYALPAIILARDLGKRLIVSTATVALQEQLVNKDLPDLQAGTELDFSFVLAKGRRRYLCLSQLDRLIASSDGQEMNPGLYPDEQPQRASADLLQSYGDMLDALGRGDWNGDRDSWPQSLEDADWLAVTADQGQCTGRRCPNISQCSFFRARDGLQGADVVVTNHDLVLSDLALGGGAILPAPEDCIYIFDEGHHLPDKVLGHFASFCRLPALRQWIGETRRSLSRGAPLLSTASSGKETLESLDTLLADCADALTGVADDAAVLFEDSADAERLRFPRGIVPQSLREQAQRQAGHWSEIQRQLQRLEAALDKTVNGTEAAQRRDEIDAWLMALGAMLARAESYLGLWRDFAADASAEEPPRARWLRRRDALEPLAIELHCSHIIAADLLEEQLWSRAAAVVMTSATMTALGSFDRFRQRAGVPQAARFKVVDSPFDYARAELCIPSMRSEPSDAAAHTEELIEMLPGLLDDRVGSLVLFSSRRQMLEVRDALPRNWRDRLLTQDDYSKQEILRRHREVVDEGRASAIFGLASFAEGVDLPGAYCRQVVIAKLPFSVPDDPVDAALAEWFESQGRNAFMEISVPDAALRLVQASGRLLRTELDSGRITVCDRRLLTRRYGRAILDSLPPFTRRFD